MIDNTKILNLVLNAVLSLVKVFFLLLLGGYLILLILGVSSAICSVKQCNIAMVFSVIAVTFVSYAAAGALIMFGPAIKRKMGRHVSTVLQALALIPLCLVAMFQIAQWLSQWSLS